MCTAIAIAVSVERLNGGLMEGMVAGAGGVPGILVSERRLWGVGISDHPHRVEVGKLCEVVRAYLLGWQRQRYVEGVGENKYSGRPHSFSQLR